MERFSNYDAIGALTRGQLSQYFLHKLLIFKALKMIEPVTRDSS